LSNKSLKSKVKGSEGSDYCRTSRFCYMRNKRLACRLYFAPAELTFSGRESSKAMPCDNLSTALVLIPDQIARNNQGSY